MSSEELENKLKKFLPDGTEKLLAEWILHYKIKVTVKRERKTKAGDYTPPIDGKNHKISILQGNLVYLA